MAYRTDLKKSARRHFRAAKELDEVSSAGGQPGCKAVAGYLFGLAGELAVKEMMRQSGLNPLPNASRRSDPFYAHFPDLKNLLLDYVSGRRTEHLRRVAESSALFQNWSTDMRYAPTDDIKPEWIVSWCVSAKKLLDQMEGS